MTNDNEVTQSSNSNESRTTIDVEGCAALYVELRTTIAGLKAELKEKIKPYQKAMEDLDGLLLRHLQDQKARSIRTESGTVYQYVERSATIKDKKAFREFVIANEQYDLLDWRANKVQVFDWIENNKTDVPGVNTSAFMTIGVRKGDTSTQEDE